MPNASSFQILLRENRRTFFLALPIVAGLVGQMLMGIADTIMVGRVGVVPLAACAFANTILVVPMVFGFGLLSAVSVNASHAHGARRTHLAGDSLRGGVLLALGMGLMAGGGAHAGVPLLRLLGQPQEINTTVGVFFLLCAWSLLPLFVSGAAKNFCEALGRPWAPFWIMMSGVLLNVFLNWILIYGNLGAPAMGLNGAGVATLLSRIAVMCGMLVYPAVEESLSAAWPRDWLAPGLLEESWRLLKTGIHTAGLNLCEVTGFSFGSLMMGWLGVVPLAAHQIALSVAGTTFMVPLGLAQAVSVRVGHARGASRAKRIPTIVHGSLGLTAGVMAVFAAGYWLLGNAIAAGFTPDLAVRTLTVQLLVLAGVFQIFDGIQVVSSGALRGFADTKVPFVVGIVAYWLVALPVSWMAAFHFGFGAPGIWVGFVVGLGVAAVAMCTRLLRKCKRLNVSPIPSPVG
ncbi:MAG: MATE family efflux transporter [bacterium]